MTTSGCQDALCKAIDMLLAGEPEGEPVLVEDFIYAATIAMMEPYNPKYLVVESDENGLRSDRLREVIERHVINFIYQSLYIMFSLLLYFS